MFRFEFEAMLRLREAERDASRAELAAAIVRQTAVRGQREELQRVKSETVLAYRETRIGLLRIDALRKQGDFEQQMAAEDAELARIQKDLEAEIGNRQNELVSAEIEFRKWEALRKRAQLAWATRNAKLQQREVDDVSARRHPRMPHSGSRVGPPPMS